MMHLKTAAKKMGMHEMRARKLNDRAHVLRVRIQKIQAAESALMTKAQHEADKANEYLAIWERLGGRGKHHRG